MSINYQFFALLLRPATDGQKRITVGPGFRVDGGDETDHKGVVEFSEHFLDNLRTAHPETVRETIRIFQRTMEKEFGKRGDS